MTESLLEKYPHLKTLTKLNESLSRNINDVKRENVDVAPDEAQTVQRKSILGPAPKVGCKLTITKQENVSRNKSINPKRKAKAEDLFAASVVADDDEWLEFQIDESLPAKEQLDLLKVWLVTNSPSRVGRSSGIGWIAVKFKDKGKKVLKAKEAWDSYQGERNMDVVNKLADEYNVKGGKWLCHLPTSTVDKIWSNISTTLISGGLGPHVFMVKVSPLNDLNKSEVLEDSEHVICVYNTNYKDEEQVMRVENLMRSAGICNNLTYKPDIFSALGIYRNNKWGFRATIYNSHVFVMEGRSKIEVVGTDKWFYNTSKGIVLPDRDSKTPKDVCSRSDLKTLVENQSRSKVATTQQKLSGNNSKIKIPVQNSLPSLYKLPFQSLDDMLEKVDEKETCNDGIKVDMPLIIGSSVSSSSSPLNEGTSASKAKETCINNLKVDKSKMIASSVSSIASPLNEAKSISKAKPRQLSVSKLVDNLKKKNNASNKEDEMTSDISFSSIQSNEKPKKKSLHAQQVNKKPAWLLKLEELQLRSMDEMLKS